MNFGFLLRFQEVLKPAITNKDTAETRTFIEKEKPDEELVVPLAATKTFTEVKQEDADPDPQSRSFNVFLR
jgi:hypothetical protein